VESRDRFEVPPFALEPGDRFEAALGALGPRVDSGGLPAFGVESLPAAPAPVASLDSEARLAALGAAEWAADSVDHLGASRFRHDYSYTS
jgi:hypothetical protein